MASTRSARSRRARGAVPTATVAICAIIPLVLGPAHAAIPIYGGDVNQYADECACELGGGEVGYMPIGVMPSDAQEIPVFWNQKRITFEQTTPGDWEFLFDGKPGQAKEICSGGGNEGLPCMADSDCPGGTCPTAGYPDAANIVGRITNTAALKCDYWSHINGPTTEMSPTGGCVPGQRQLQTQTCTSGTRTGGACQSDGDCPGGACGEVVWTFAFRRVQPPQTPRCTNDATQTCLVDADCPGGAVGTCPWTPSHPNWFSVMDVNGLNPSTGGVCWFDTLGAAAQARCMGGAKNGMKCRDRAACDGAPCERSGTCVGGTSPGAFCLGDPECAGGGTCGELGGMVEREWWMRPGVSPGIPRPGGKDSAKRARALDFWDTPQVMRSGDCTQCHGNGPFLISRWMNQSEKICNGGANDTKACKRPEDCPGGTCDPTIQRAPFRAFRETYEQPFWNTARLLPDRPFFIPSQQRCANCHGSWSTASATCPGGLLAEAMTSVPFGITEASAFRLQSDIAPAMQSAGAMYEMPHPFAGTPAAWETNVRPRYNAIKPCCRVCDVGDQAGLGCENDSDCRRCKGGVDDRRPCLGAGDCTGGTCEGGVCVVPRVCGTGPRETLACLGDKDCGDCAGGTSAGRACTVASDCPGGTCVPGTCAPAGACADTAAPAPRPTFFGAHEPTPAFTPAVGIAPPDAARGFRITIHEDSCQGGGGNAVCNYTIEWTDPLDDYQAPNGYYLETVAVSSEIPDPEPPASCPAKDPAGGEVSPVGQCAGGASMGADCTDDSDCPGGTCALSSWRRHYERHGAIAECTRLAVRLCGGHCDPPRESIDAGQTVVVATTCASTHFDCYEVERKPFAPHTGVDVVDRYGASTVDLTRPKRLCAPADKRDEDPLAPLRPDHLVGYVLKQRTPKVAPIRGQRVTNQFGTIVVDLLRPDYLLVPAAKSLTGTPPALATPAVNHFKCYKVRGARTRVPAVEVRDQFGTFTIDVKQPLRLCLPADKEGEDLLGPLTALMCYKIRPSIGFPRFRGPDAPVYTSDQFGTLAPRVKHQRELCVPSEVATP